jgi:hypothetical protein
LNTNALTDDYIYFCLNRGHEFLRTFKIQKGKSAEEFISYCLRLFILSGERSVGRKRSRIENKYLQDALQYIEANSSDLWQIYSEDKGYKEVFKDSWDFIKNLRAQFYDPPINSIELNYIFGALEAFMLLEEKNLL